MKKKAISVKISSLFPILGVVVLGLIVFIGCGKKEPPLPPIVEANKIAAPFDLKYRVEGSKIHLSWDHRTDSEKAVVKPDAFEIFLAKKTFEACEGCPFKFKMVGVVSMPSMEFGFPVEKGFKYYFRVQAVGGDNLRSEYTKTVQYEFE